MVINGKSLDSALSACSQTEKRMATLEELPGWSWPDEVFKLCDKYELGHYDAGRWLLYASCKAIENAAKRYTTNELIVFHLELADETIDEPTIQIVFKLNDLDELLQAVIARPTAPFAAIMSAFNRRSMYCHNGDKILANNSCSCCLSVEPSRCFREYEDGWTAAVREHREKKLKPDTPEMRPEKQ